jgi:hypothetical protein
MTISFCARRQPATKEKQPVDKLMLLQLVKKLVVAEHRTPGQGMALLKSFAQDHDLQITGSNKMFKDTAVIQVRFNPHNDFSCYDFFNVKSSKAIDLP